MITNGDLPAQGVVLIPGGAMAIVRGIIYPVVYQGHQLPPAVVFSSVTRFPGAVLLVASQEAGGFQWASPAAQQPPEMFRGDLVMPGQALNMMMPAWSPLMAVIFNVPVLEGDDIELGRGESSVTYAGSRLPLEDAELPPVVYRVLYDDPALGQFEWRNAPGEWGLTTLESGGTYLISSAGPAVWSIPGGRVSRPLLSYVSPGGLAASGVALALGGALLLLSGRRR